LDEVLTSHKIFFTFSAVVLGKRQDRAFSYPQRASRQITVASTKKLAKSYPMKASV